MKLWRSVKNYLLPWRGNSHRPHILRRQWLVALLGVAMLSEMMILGASVLTGSPNVFLAAVIKSDVIAYTDEARVGEGGQPLVENEALDAAAQAKAQDMAARGYFSHVGPGGEEPWAWIERAGYKYVYAGENLAVRFDDSKDVVDAWMASPTHRANIVKANYKEIGVGLAEGTYKGEHATFVVQYFGSPAAPVASAAPLAPEAPAEPAAGQALASAQAVSEAPAGPAVAGAETHTAVADMVPTPTPPQSFMQSVVRAVTRAMSDAPQSASWLLGGIAALLVAVLALTFFVRIQVQPTDLLLPGLAVALIAITFVAANAKFLPATNQAASVANAGAGDIAGGDATERVRVAFPEAPAQ